MGLLLGSDAIMRDKNFMMDGGLIWVYIYIYIHCISIHHRLHDAPLTICTPYSTCTRT